MGKSFGRVQLLANLACEKTMFWATFHWLKCLAKVTTKISASFRFDSYINQLQFMYRGHIPSNFHFYHIRRLLAIWDGPTLACDDLGQKVKIHSLVYEKSRILIEWRQWPNMSVMCRWVAQYELMCLDPGTNTNLYCADGFLTFDHTENTTIFKPTSSCLFDW